LKDSLRKYCFRQEFLCLLSLKLLGTSAWHKNKSKHRIELNRRVRVDDSTIPYKNHKRNTDFHIRRRRNVKTQKSKIGRRRKEVIVFEKLRFQSIFLPHKEGSVWRAFQKAPFSWRISVEDRRRTSSNLWSQHTMKIKSTKRFY